MLLVYGVIIFFYTAKHKTSRFDIILSGFLPPVKTVHTSDILSEMARIVKPNGQVFLQEVNETDKLTRDLKLAGFIDISPVAHLCSQGITIHHLPMYHIQYATIHKHQP